MKTRIHSADLQEMIVDAEYPYCFNDLENDIVDRACHVDSILGKNFYREIFFEGVHIIYSTLSLYQNTLMEVDSELETIKMHFMLFGDTWTKDNDSRKEYEFGCNQHNIFYTHQFKCDTEWAKNDNMEIFEVHLWPSFFEKYLPGHDRAFEDFKQRLHEKTTAQIYKHHLQITSAMHLIIREIVQVNRTGMFKRMFVEAKLIELLMLQLEQVSEQFGGTFYTLKKADVERMYEVKEIILKNIASPYTLNDLAQQVGTNEFTLKKGFKEVFGTTVFGFWHQLKMQEAKMLLLDSSLTVTEISDRMGYKNLQNFSLAFKKHFGMSPSKLKN